MPNAEDGLWYLLGLVCLSITIVRFIPMRKVRDWSAVIDRLNSNPKGELKIKMGSPGSAQVTRCRLLAEWSNLDATTKGATLLLRLPGGRK
jgi:hypothetical protein